MTDILNMTMAGGGSALAVVMFYLRVIATRLDRIDDKQEIINKMVLDHEVRLRVMEKSSA